MMTSDMLQKAIRQIQAGDKAGGGKILQELVKQEPLNWIAWLWLATCVTAEDQKRYCLQKAYTINPDNENVKSALAQLGPANGRSIPAQVSKAPGEMLSQPEITPSKQTIQFIPANCPNCGGELRVPENRKVVKCMYCGHDVIIHDPSAISIQQLVDVDKISKLAKISQDGGNYQEAFRYYAQILESEPDNDVAWLGRGLCAGMQSTGNSLRLDEATTCFNHATEPKKDRDAQQTLSLNLLRAEYEFRLVTQIDKLAGQITTDPDHFVALKLEALMLAKQGYEYFTTWCYADNLHVQDARIKIPNDAYLKLVSNFAISFLQACRYRDKIKNADFFIRRAYNVRVLKEHLGNFFEDPQLRKHIEPYLNRYEKGKHDI